MKISASIFHPIKPPAEFAKQAVDAGSNCFHLDYVAGTPSPLPIADIPAFTERYPLPLDVHLVQSAVTAEDCARWREIMPQYLTVQLEPLSQTETLAPLSECAVSLGAGISVSSSLDLIDPVRSSISHIMLMCGSPGRPGGAFDEECIYRITELRQLFPELRIHVDGGIDANAMNLLRAFHVDLVVSGSYLAKADNIYASICRLRFGHHAHSLTVAQIMTPYSHLPVIQTTTAFRDILPTVSHWYMGMVMVVDSDRTLAGIITDGDLRRHLQKREQGIFGTTASDIMNPYPRTIPPDMNILVFAKFLSDGYKGLVVVPVVGNDGKLVGAVDLHSHLLF